MSELRTIHLIDADKPICHLSDYALQESVNPNDDGQAREIHTAIYSAIQNCISAVEEQPSWTIIRPTTDDYKAWKEHVRGSDKK